MTIQELRRVRHIERGAFLLGALVVLGQRVAIGGIQTSTILLLITVVWTLIYARPVVQVRSIALYVIVVLGCCIATVVASVTTNAEPSVLSLILLLVTYAPLLLVQSSAGSPAAFGQLFFRGVVAAILLGSVLAIIQYFAQAFGLGYVDPVGLLPSEWLVTGFNSYYDLRYAGGLQGQFKPNGMIFLEPSFLSLYAAIALVFMFNRLVTPGGQTEWTVLALCTLAFAMVISASASGVLVLTLTAVPMLMTVRRNRLVVIALTLIALVAFAAGAFNQLIAKSSESLEGNTSAALRLTMPYQVLGPVWLEHPAFGWGPGSASRFLDAYGLAGLQASTVMKSLVEYGLAGGLAIGLAVGITLAVRGAPLPLRLAVIFAWLIPSEALLNSVIVLLLVFGLPNWSTTPVASLLTGTLRVPAYTARLRLPSESPRV